MIVGVENPLLTDARPAPFPVVIATLHMAYWECLTWTPLYFDSSYREIGVIFRPLNNASADAWVKATRERFGLKLLSRKTGLQEAFKLLKRNATVSLLIDQNAGDQGALTTLFGRVCSTTELAGLLTEKYGAKLTLFFPIRTGFWRMRFWGCDIRHDGSAAGATLALNREFEKLLGEDDNICASWLWSHDRWRNQDVPERRFRLEAKRNLLERDLAERGALAPQRRTRIWVRLPNWLGDVVMALPLLRALRRSRPDAQITVIGKGAFAPFLQATGLIDQVIALPPRGFGYFRFFQKLHAKFPDVYVLFTNSFRGDLEAWLTKCRQRFGVVRPGKHRPLLTHTYRATTAGDEKTRHQLATWEALFRRFGLVGELDLTPLQLDTSPSAAASSAPVFALIAGSENTPAKRWPVSHFRALIEKLSAVQPHAEFLLLGTANDRAITSQIGAGLSANISDLAGKTDLLAFADQLRRCSLLISNDTGGMHLANALGVPVVALFGPTNPVRTKPVFHGPVSILQPPGCPETGGGNLAELLPETVFETILQLLPQLARL
jgi:lipopolysaccharide heptosyltransferase II